jgi:hypothetical protein
MRLCASASPTWVFAERGEGHTQCAPFHHVQKGTGTVRSRRDGLATDGGANRLRLNYNISPASPGGSGLQVAGMHLEE